MQRMNRDAHRLRGRWLQVAGRKNMRAAHPHTPRQERITCTLANKFAVFFLISWCRCLASAAVQPRRLVVHSTKSPAGAVQPAQWRELDSSSSRAPAELPAVMRCSRRLSELRSSSVSGGTATDGKEHEGSAPSYSAAGENHLLPADQPAVSQRFADRVTPKENFLHFFLSPS